MLANAMPENEEDDQTPPDDDLRRRPIPVDTPPIDLGVTANGSRQARAIPFGSTADLESRVRPALMRSVPTGRAIPVDASQQSPAMAAPTVAPSARAIPIGSTGDLESRIRPMAKPITVQPEESPYPATAAENAAPDPNHVKSGIASLWANARNISHPVPRVLAEIGAGLARGLDVAGQAAGRVIPGIAGIEASIPGTEGNARAQENRQAQQDAQQAKLASEEAGTEHVKAETGAIPAETGLKEAQTKALETPKPEKPENVQQIYADAVQDAVSRGVDPNADPKVKQLADTITELQKEPAGAKVPPLSADQASQRNAIWDPILTKNHLPTSVFKEGMSDADAKELAGQLNNATGKTQAGVKIDLGQDKGSKSENIKARQEVAKIYADPMASAERYNVMTDSLDAALKNHDQQAMLNLLTNHIGMTMGLQKGARITQAILQEAQQSQPWLANVKAKFDKDGYLSGVTLGPAQMKSMVNLARGRFSQDVVKARSLAKYAGAEDDGPDRIPSTSTMHYYLDQAGNDVPKPKAKQLAAQDGWTVSGKK